MTLKELIKQSEFEIINLAEENSEISGVYCCDLLSFVMGKAFSGCAWVTVMGNVNSVAVAVLADIGCIILADNVTLDDAALERAKQNDVNILRSKQPIFNTALVVHEAISK